MLFRENRSWPRLHFGTQPGSGSKTTNSKASLRNEIVGWYCLTNADCGVFYENLENPNSATSIANLSLS